MDLSEHTLRPSKILLHHPQHGGAFTHLTTEELRHINFLDLPDVELFYREYNEFVDAIKQFVEVVYLKDILGADAQFAAEAAKNPNLIFMRDSSITLPWAPQLYIPARLALPSRANESAVVAHALQILGLEPAVAFEGDEYIEGGDVLPAIHLGQRVLLIGFGARTTKAAAMKLAQKLMPKYIDQIIGLSHDENLLHLDTGFTVLPGQIMFAAAGMFESGFMIDANGVRDINPIQEAEKNGFTIFRCEKNDAITHERCNLLPLGGGEYLAFEMPEQLKADLEKAASITIHTVKGAEITKATGGVHCLTRPLYI